MLPHVNIKRIAEELTAINAFNSTPERGTTRVLFTKEELGARVYVKALMEQTGLTVTEDAVGNIFGLLSGTDPALSPVISGSHIDTVLNAGKFDGTVGVIGAIEACRLIRESGIKHKRGVIACVFTSEEPTRFGVGCIGSRAMTGHLTLDDAKVMRDDAGKTLYEVLDALGYSLNEFDAVRRKAGDFYASIELHIEQAPVLEQLCIPIGIVEGICAPTYIHVQVFGEQGHAGSTPMQVRKDAVCATSEIVLKLESLAKTFNTRDGNPSTVGTVGKIIIYPNAPNVIAGKTSFVIDIRDADADSKNRLTDEMLAYFQDVERARKVKITYEIAENDLPRHSDPALVAMLEEVCRDKGVTYRKMFSGAYHDSLLLGEIVPMAMIFVPSRGGISHDPAEFTEDAQISVGVNILAEALLTLANED
ncbi:MAG: M20 family metallo-hydrolase [Oscillospiraceae bacterium]